MDSFNISLSFFLFLTLLIILNKRRRRKKLWEQSIVLNVFFVSFKRVYHLHEFLGMRHWVMQHYDFPQKKHRLIDKILLDERKQIINQNHPYLPDFVITISVPSLWNFSHKSFPSRVTLGSSTTPSSSGWMALRGLTIAGWWCIAAAAKTTSSAVV